MIATDPEVENIRKKFLELTGLYQIEFRLEQVGPEKFLYFIVGMKAPLYSTVIGQINRELDSESPFHGRITIACEPPDRLLNSLEIDLLSALIQRSLTVTKESLFDPFRIRFAPFRGKEEIKVTLKTNHIIWGRRGVGKSSLILMAVERLKDEGHIPIWLNLNLFSGEEGPTVVINLINKSLEAVIEAVEMKIPKREIKSAKILFNELKGLVNKGSLKDEDLIKIIPRCHEVLSSITKKLNRNIFLFLDDAHLVLAENQPYVFYKLLSVFKGAGGYLKIAGVKTLLKLYNPQVKIGLQIPHDIQSIELDLNLVNPSAARGHLESVLHQFIQSCGFSNVGKILANKALDRLVWCSAGVPRDFLWLFESAVGSAKLEGRKKVGVQDVNIAVGSFSQVKMGQIEEDTPQESKRIKQALEILQAKCLDEFKTNAFLSKQGSNEAGYLVLKKIVDLRLIHLINPSITPKKAGERYEAYLLDYSFYTGVRRRQGIKELKIGIAGTPRYSELRKLPKFDPAILVEKN